jgi:hypothetical protein
MGCGTSETNTQSWTDQTQQTTYAPASADEQALRQQFQDLGTSQNQTLQGLMDFSRNGSALSLSPQDQSQLDQAFNSAQQRLQIQGKDYADFLSGSRGLRMSDTPIAQQALDRFGLGMADLNSQRAMAGLNLGLASNQFKTNLGLMSSQALPSGSIAAFNPLFQERMASGSTHVQGTGNVTQTKNDSIMSQILQGTQAYNQMGQGTNQFASAGMKMFGG